MKKIKYIVFVLLVLALFFALYTYANAFHVRNVEEVTLGSKSLGKDELIINGFSNISKYDIDQLEDNILTQILFFEMKFGDDVEFEVYFDYDFEKVIVKPANVNQYYGVDGELATYLYSLIENEDFFAYENFVPHSIKVNDQEIKHTKGSYTYQSYDLKWHETTIANTEEDVIEINEPKIIIEVASLDDNVILTVTQADEELYKGPPSLYVVPYDNGEFTYTITSTYDGEVFNGSETSVFKVLHVFEPEFKVSKEVVTQGEYIIIQCTSVLKPETLFIEQSFIEGLSFVKVGDVYECLVPTGYYTSPGKYYLDYGADDYAYELAFEVKERAFNYQNLTISKSTVASTKNDDARDEYNRLVPPALSKNVYNPDIPNIFDQVFVIPTTGRITTEFGVKRYVNNELTAYRHSGIDIATPTGSEVVATYKGKVVLAQELIMTGNTVIINHGQGVFSSYLHLNEININEGDMVDTGQLIGAVGTTGFSTGPHLHFSISFYRMNLEPGYFIYGEPVTYDNYNELFY